MRRIQLFLALFCFSLLACEPEEVLKPQAPAGSFVYGGEGREAGFGLLELGDGNILIVGTARKEENSDYDLQLVLVSPTGEELQTRDYRNESLHEAGHRMIKTSTGYAIIGFQSPLNNQGSTGKVWLLDDNFDLVQEKSIILSTGYSYASTFINAFHQLPNGGFLAGQSTNSENVVFLLDSDLQLVGTNRLTVNYWDTNCEFIKPVNGGFMAASSAYDYNGSGQTVVVSISFFDENGELQWATANNLSVNGYSANINAVAALSNGELAVIASFNYSDNILMRFDSAGNYLSQVNIDYAGMLGRVRELPSGNLLIGGNSTNSYYDYEQGRASDFVLMEVDSSGAILWQRSYGGQSAEHAHDLLIGSVGSYYLAGSTTSFGLGESDNYLVIYNP